MQQIGTDHDPSATFACLAVDGGHMIVVLTQPLVEVLTERLDQLQLRGVMVFKGVLCNWRGTKKTRLEHSRTKQLTRRRGGKQARHTPQFTLCFNCTHLHTPAQY